MTFWFVFFPQLAHFCPREFLQCHEGSFGPNQSKFCNRKKGFDAKVLPSSFLGFTQDVEVHRPPTRHAAQPIHSPTPRTRTGRALQHRPKTPPRCPPPVRAVCPLSPEAEPSGGGFGSYRRAVAHVSNRVVPWRSNAGLLGGCPTGAPPCGLAPRPQRLAVAVVRACAKPGGTVVVFVPGRLEVAQLLGRFQTLPLGRAPGVDGSKAQAPCGNANMGGRCSILLFLDVSFFCPIAQDRFISLHMV